MGTAAGAAVCQLEHVPLVAKPKSNWAPENYAAVVRSVINVEQRAAGPHTNTSTAEAD